MSTEEIHDLLAYDGLKIIQRKDLFRFSLDSLLLGDFVRINPRANMILDFGTGLGPVPLYLSLKTDKRIVGIDIQEEAVSLARKSVELNELTERIEIIQADMKEITRFFQPSSIDIITVNPPFFKYHSESFTNDLDSLTISRHEVSIDLEGVVVAARKVISNGGTLFMIHRAARIEELILLFHKYNFAIKRLRFVHTGIDKEAMMILVEAKFNGKTGDIKVETPLSVYDAKGNYTEEILRIFHLGDVNHDQKSQLPE